MTLVVAAKFGERLVMISDTMVSDTMTSGIINLRDPRKSNDIIPGQLKSIILNGQLSISYAGTVSTGIRIIRQVADLILKTNDIDIIIEFIVCEHIAVSNTKFSCDFIVASHLKEPKLFRICDDIVSQGGNRYWIGNNAPLKNLREAEDACPAVVHHPFWSREETCFRHAIRNRLIDPAAHAEHNVGGLVVELTASPFGHCYEQTSFAKNWDTIDLRSGGSAQQNNDRASGMTQFVCHIFGSFYRGAGVLGAFIEQANIGYIYRPTKEYDPERLYPSTAAEVATLVTSHAIEMGGFLNEA